jgi:hydrogenase-4 component E
MSGALVAFAIVLLVPLFVATWRTSVLGLALQGLLISWLALGHSAELSVGTAITAIDAALLRMIAAPAVLYVAMRDRQVSARNDVIAPNLFSWAIALGLVVAAFRAAAELVPGEGPEQTLTAVSATAFLLGLFVLATARGTFSQIVGLMRVENAIALFELGSSGHDVALWLRAVLTSLLLVSIGFFRWYLAKVPRQEPPPSSARGASAGAGADESAAATGAAAPSGSAVP